MIVNSKNFKIIHPTIWSNDEITSQLYNFETKDSENENIEIKPILLKDIFKKITDILPHKREEVCE